MGLVEGDGGKDAKSFPEKLGEFRLIRQLGGGGTGTASEAIADKARQRLVQQFLRAQTASANTAPST